MKTLLKILTYVLLLVVIAAVGVLIYLFIGFPVKEEPQKITIHPTTEGLARGEYLARHVNVCLHCHADRRMDYFATPPIPGTEGQGGFFVKQEGLGDIYSPNITPHALSNWTDGEIIRSVTAGVNKAGDPLFPIMPYKVYAHLKQEDLHAVISYIRTLKPIQKEIPRSDLEFPMNLIVRMIPGPEKPDTVAQSNPGHYLVRIAGCMDCHTPIDDRNQPIPGMEFAGGQKFGHVQSANITTDPETGIGIWTREDFIAAFKKWQDPSLQQIVVSPDRNTVMPWIDFSGMKEEDLSAIYDYLRTVKPIRNRIEKFPHPVQ